MIGRQNMPDWVKSLLTELTKPPTFLMGDQKLVEGFEPLVQSDDSPATTEPRHDHADSTERRTEHKHKNRVDPDRRSTSLHVKATTEQSANHAREVRVANDTREPDEDASLSRNDQQRKWRAIFIQSGIPDTLPNHYGWTVRKAESMDNILHVQTAKREFAVKQTHIPVQRVRFLHKLCLFVARHGFTRVPRFALTSKRDPMVVHGGNTFYATRWIQGNPSNFSNVTQVGQIATALAEFHEASRGFETTDYHPPMEFQLGQMQRRRSEDLRTLLLDAELKKEPDEFDKVFLELAPALRSDAEESIRLIEDKRVQTLLAQEEETPGVCHLDVIPGNFLYDAEQRIHLIDLDLATYAPRALDIAHLLRRSLQVTNFNSEAAYWCFLNYDRVRSIPPEEYLLVQGLLRFPYRVWRLAHTRYRLFSDLEQIEDIRLYRVQEERRQAFLTAFMREIEQQRQ